MAGASPLTANRVQTFQYSWTILMLRYLIERFSQAALVLWAAFTV
jgi:hypothetical protein